MPGASDCAPTTMRVSSGAVARTTESGLARSTAGCAKPLATAPAARVDAERPDAVLRVDQHVAEREHAVAGLAARELRRDAEDASGRRDRARSRFRRRSPRCVPSSRGAPRLAACGRLDARDRHRTASVEVGERLQQHELVVGAPAVAQVDQAAAHDGEIALVRRVGDDRAEHAVRERPVAGAAGRVGAARREARLVPRIDAHRDERVVAASRRRDREHRRREQSAEAHPIPLVQRRRSLALVAQERSARKRTR
jgi:hypothetical protein